ncbi:MAG: M20 family peptidase, partial [Candidatus Omnitrophota bacterium]
MVNRKRLIKLTQDLLRINSENPPGNERAIARFVSGYLKNMGLRPKIVSFYPNRDNVLAVLPGRRSRSSLLITPHLDTVPAGTGW